MDLVVSFQVIPILYKSVEKCLQNVCFSNPANCIITVFFRATKLSTPNVKQNYYTWEIPICWHRFLPLFLPLILTLYPIETLVT